MPGNSAADPSGQHPLAQGRTALPLSLGPSLGSVLVGAGSNSAARDTDTGEAVGGLRAASPLSRRVQDTGVPADPRTAVGLSGSSWGFSSGQFDPKVPPPPYSEP